MTDPHRPTYHLLPPSNWMNDPNGLIQFNGVYHVFYQHNPHGALWGNMSWGHATSTDLVHWQHQPVAITPDADGPDADGCYSGAMVLHNGTPTMVYTGVRETNELACLAYPADETMVKWTKYDRNPVISGPPADVPVTIFRDHTLWRDGDGWLMGIGSGIEGSGGAVLLYRSDDLLAWEYLHPLAVEQPALNPTGQQMSSGWECPDFFFVDDQPVLLACDWDGDPIGSSWWRGTYVNQRFTAIAKGATDYGDCLYAPQTFQAEDGRRLFFGWLRELRSDADQLAAGWSGVMSLPREVVLLPNDGLGFRPVAGLEVLRGECERGEISTGEILTSAASELVLSFARPFRISWGDAMTVGWDGAQLFLLSAGKLHAVPCGPGDARLFIDHSVVELYVADQVVSTRVYGSASTWDAAMIATQATDAGEVTVWQMDTI